MAVELGSLVAEVKEKIELDTLKNKTLAVDAYNTIYQFLSIIRQPNGMPLTDRDGRVTSHLSGLFYRNINLFEHGITPIYVFDGVPPILKQKTIEARMNRREEARKEWNKALAEGRIEEARTHAMASTRINKEIVQSSKDLLDYMGITYIQAPSEGEAQAARMAKEGAVYAAASQDYDLFLFGSDTVIRNLTISGRRKIPRKNVYVDITPERIVLQDLLKNLGINQIQLIWLGILIGTDFDEGIEGIGPKTALRIVKESKSLDDIVRYLDAKGKSFDVSPEEVEKIFIEPETAEIKKDELREKIKSASPDKESIIKFMCEEHGFSEERIGKFADTLIELKNRAGQKGIDSWI